MIVYPVAGSSVSLTSNGALDNASTLQTISLYDGTEVAVPVSLSLKGETSKRGQRRVVLRLEGKMDGKWLNSDNGGSAVLGEIPVSAHLVVQAPQGTVQFERGTAGASKLLVELVKILIAVITNKSVPASDEVGSMNGVLLSALAGASTLNVVSGTYGNAS